MSVIVPESSKIMRRSRRPVGFKSPVRLIHYLSKGQISAEAFVSIIKGLNLTEEQKTEILENPTVLELLKEKKDAFKVDISSLMPQR
jgi:hypothetical protein